jgi:TIP41-like family
MEASKWATPTPGSKVGAHSVCPSAHNPEAIYLTRRSHFNPFLSIRAIFCSFFFFPFRRTGADSQISLPHTIAMKPYDWTYTTTYAGSLDDAGPGNAAQWIAGDPDNTQHAIPIAELSRPDPILFYAEIPLFEDELHDNGASHLLVRIVCSLSLSPPPPAPSSKS